ALSLRRSVSTRGPPEGGPHCGVVGSLDRRRPMVAAAALHLLQHDTVEEHGQLGGADLQACHVVALGHGEAKDPLLQSLVPDGPAVCIPGEDLEAVTTTVAKDEPVAGQGISAEALLHQGRQAVEGFATIDGAKRLLKNYFTDSHHDHAERSCNST